MPDWDKDDDFGTMDQLDYQYFDGSNRLRSVTDGILKNDTSGKGEFVDGNKDGDDYVYDPNGNMTQDLNKGIKGATLAEKGIEYNHLNLPTKVSIDDGGANKGTISYIYDATGVKLRKNVLKQGETTPTPTDYAGNYIYENGKLQFFSQPEGYVEPKDPNSLSLGYDYIYQYKDHLGNIRLSYKNVGSASNVDLEIQEENNYYPFGLKHKGYNTVQNGRNHKYGFGGKEEQDEVGLEWMGFGARNYDASLGRWMNLDPLAEIYHTDTPYAYVLNNPLSFIDPDGREVVGVTKNDATRFFNVLKRVFGDEKFDKLRGLFTRGKNNNKKKFDKIEDSALKDALSGLEGDDLALAEVVTSAINSEDEHKIEFLTSDDEEASTSGSDAITDYVKSSVSFMNVETNENGKVSHSKILDLGGGGFNVPTDKGSHSFISPDAFHPNGGDVTSIHEVFGHGIPSAKKLSAVQNNANAIKTENLVLRVLGKSSRQRDGSGKDGGALHAGGKVTGSRSLPIKN